MRIISCLTLCTLPLLSGCLSNFDLQGSDPHEYYAQNPIVNRVESKQLELVTHFDMRATELSQADAAALRAQLANVSPASVAALHVAFSKQSLLDDKRKESLGKLLRGAGFTQPVIFEKDEALARNDVRLSVEYAQVVSPDCPDWKMAPSHTFSNKAATNFGCANTNNLGLMVADPRDLVMGSGTDIHDTQSSTKAIEDYNSGSASPAAAAAPASSAVPAAASPSQ